MRSFLTGVKKILQAPEDVLILTRWRCGGIWGEETYYFVTEGEEEGTVLIDHLSFNPYSYF